MLRKLMSHPNTRRFGKIAVFAGHCAFCAGIGALFGPTSLLGFLICIPSCLLALVVCLS